MILTEQDIALAWIGINDPIALGGNFKDSEHVKNFAANLEAAILAKLASAELPEPVELNPAANSVLGHTADQLRQAYAQGAAAQLSEKPRLYAYTVNKVHNEYCEFEPPDDAYDEGTLTPLYTRKEPK